MSAPTFDPDRLSVASEGVAGPERAVPPSSAPFVLGVAGGTGSGKTTVARRLADVVGLAGVALLSLDAYYCDHGDRGSEPTRPINYDHPDAFDWSLLLDHLGRLRRGEAVDVPVYDFARDVRTTQCLRVHPSPVVIVEGILVLYEPALRDQFDLKVYVDTDADVRFIRRLQRDVAERGRTPASVIDQYLDTVRPSHLQFIEPTKRYADVILPHGGRNEPAVGVLLARLRELVADRTGTDRGAGTPR